MCTGEAATRSGTLVGLTTGIGGMNDDPRNAVSIHLWASLVPAAAVIPAQVAYFDVVAVKKLGVGWHPRDLSTDRRPPAGGPERASLTCPLFFLDTPTRVAPSGQLDCGVCLSGVEHLSGSDFPKKRGGSGLHQGACTCASSVVLWTAVSRRVPPYSGHRCWPPSVTQRSRVA